LVELSVPDDREFPRGTFSQAELTNW